MGNEMGDISHIPQKLNNKRVAFYIITSIFPKTGTVLIQKGGMVFFFGTSNLIDEGTNQNGWFQNTMKSWLILL